MEWLDLTLTQNRSFNDVSGQLGVGGQFAGFRYATQAEVHDLLLHAGFSAEPKFFSTNAGDLAAGAILVSLLGQTLDVLESGIRQSGFDGIVDSHNFFGFGPEEIDIGFVVFQTPCAGDPNCVTDEAIGAGSSGPGTLDLTNPSIGSFLVRGTAATTVPEPASSTLLATAFAALLLAYRRNRRTV